jgi:hypothetical protein
VRRLERCPICESQDFVPVSLPSDLAPEHLERFAAVLIADPRYAVCRRCGLLFARARQSELESEAYYAAFAELEKRDYAVFPPPPDFLAAQALFAERLIGVLERAGILRPQLRVLNLRSECGAILARLRDRHAPRELVGLDHFESNLRHAREVLGLVELGPLGPHGVGVDFAPQHFDLVLANHQLTHALEPETLMSRLVGLLAPDGALVLYNEQNHEALLATHELFAAGVNNFHKQLLSARSLENACRRAGLAATLLDPDPGRIRFASGPFSMIVAARRAERGEVLALLPSRHAELLAAIRRGRRAARLRAQRARLRELLGIEWLRSRARRSRAVSSAPPG